MLQRIILELLKLILKFQFQEKQGRKAIGVNLSYYNYAYFCQLFLGAFVRSISVFIGR